MDFSAWMDDVKERLQDLSLQAREYFSQLNGHEKYGWIAETSGFALLVVGVVLLIV